MKQYFFRIIKAIQSEGTYVYIVSMLRMRDDTPVWGFNIKNA